MRNPRICRAALLAWRTRPLGVKNITPLERFESTAALMFSEVLARRRSACCELLQFMLLLFQLLDDRVVGVHRETVPAPDGCLRQ